MSRKGLHKAVIASGIALALFATCAFSKESYAADSSFPSSQTAQSIKKKADYHALNTCYTLTLGGDKNYYKKNGRYDNAGNDIVKGLPDSANWHQLYEEVKPKAYEYGDEFGFTSQRIFPAYSAANLVYFPNGITAATDDSSNCSQVINGTGSDGWTESLYKRVGKASVEFNRSSDEAHIDTFMMNMGYIKTTESSSEEKKCISITYTPVIRGREGYTGSLPTLAREETGSACFDVKDGVITSSTAEFDMDNISIYSTKYLRFDGSENDLQLVIRYNNVGDYEEERNDCAYSSTCYAPGHVYYYEDWSSGMWNNIYFYNMTWTEFESQVRTLMGKLSQKSNGTDYDYYALGCEGYHSSSGMLWWYKDAYCSGGQFEVYITNAELKIWDSGSKDTVWKLNNRSSATIDRAISFLGGTSLNAQKVTDSELALLYQYYIINRANGVVKCGLSPESIQSDYSAVKWFNSQDKREDCYLTNYNKGGIYNLANSDRVSWSPKGLSDLISALNGLNISTISAANKDDTSSVASSLTDTNEQGSYTFDTGAEPNCYTNSGSLGWILCPIIDAGSDFVSWIYEKFIEPFLVLDSGLFNPKEDGGRATLEAWTQFQTYANLAFVVVFLAVIFSQLTGIGIDNYGIKKILPKLIVAAILINLSYIICQLAIDVANIIGYGIKSIFDGIGKVDLSNIRLSDNPTAGIKGGVAATSILVVLTGLITAPIVLSQGVAILIPIIMAIISIVIAIFTLFCILAIRKSLAVVLVVISPLAFVAYLLPNTKKLYDKWFAAFKAVLIAFPICSAMVYGGEAVARILVLTSGSTNMPTLMALSAAVMCIAPIFLIPSTLKKSIGAISAAVDKFSRGASGYARGKFRDSNMSHDLKRRGQLNRAGIKVDKDGNVKYTKLGRLQNKLPRTKAGKQRLDAMRSDAVKSMSSASKAGSYMGAEGLKRMNSAFAAGQAGIDKQRVSDLEASYRRGNEGIDVTDTTANGDLKNALQDAIASGDVDRVKALSNIAASQGDKGRTAIKNAVKGADAAMSHATGDQKEKFEAGKKALASNIMENYAGAFKENARSTYDWAAKNQSSGAGVTMDTAEGAVESGNLRGSFMNSMDDGDFEIMQHRKENYDRIMSSGGTLSGSQAADYKNIMEAAYAAQHDQSFTATKVERQGAINELVGDYKPESVIKAETEAANASANNAQGVADAIMKAQEQRDLDAHWAGLSIDEKSDIFHDNPQQAGESNVDYMNRVVREWKEKQAQKMRRDGGHFD